MFRNRRIKALEDKIDRLTQALVNREKYIAELERKGFGAISKYSLVARLREIDNMIEELEFERSAIKTMFDSD